MCGPSFDGVGGIDAQLLPGRHLLEHNAAGIVVRALEHYAAAPAAARFTALITVHEETTFMGARAMAARWQPDVVIVVDVDFASDDPGMDAKKLGGEVKLGAGPVIHRGAGSNHVLVELARKVAAAEGIPVQIKALPGRTRTDAEELMASGQTATLSGWERKRFVPRA